MRQQFGSIQEGLDITQFMPDGKTTYYSPLTSDYLYFIDTVYFRYHTFASINKVAGANVKTIGQSGGKANGFEGDSNGLIYQLIPN